jgi:hypothetical protein
MSKYNNKKTTVDGYRFDSKKEAAYYQELCLRKRAGDIFDFDIHKRYTLVPKFINSEGKKIRAMTYTPDFVIYHDGFVEIVDVKGGKATKTQAWTLKWKLLQWQLREKRLYKFTIV